MLSPEHIGVFNAHVDKVGGEDNDLEVTQFEASGGLDAPEEKQFIWMEDLSENAQKLYVWLLGDTCTPDFLQQLEVQQGIDIQAGLQELEQFGQLDYSDPYMVRIKWKVDAGL